MKLNNCWICAILFIACFIVYFNCLEGQFVSDDLLIVEGEHILATGSINWIFPQEAIYKLVIKYFGLKPLPLHIFYVLLHSINSILVFFLLCKFFTKISAFIGALFFAVHPIHTESVSWISGGGYVWIGFFVFVTLILLSKKKMPFTLLAVLMFIYFLPHAYPWIGVFPAMLLVYNLSLKSTKFRINYLIVILFLAIAVGYVSKNIPGVIMRIKLINPKVTGQLISSDWFVSSTHSICANLWMIFFPFRLSFYHEPVIISNLQMISEATFTILLLASLYLLYKYVKPIFFGLMTFLLFLIPTYGLFRVTWIVSERYLYLPSFLFSIMIGWLWEKYAS